MKNILAAFFLCCSAFLTSCSQDGKLLKAEEYGEDWPLNVDQCYVNCVGDYAIVIKVDDKIYAVNQAAEAMDQFESIKSITKDNPNYPGESEKMSLSDIEFEGLKLCKE